MLWFTLSTLISPFLNVLALRRAHLLARSGRVFLDIGEGVEPHIAWERSVILEQSLTSKQQQRTAADSPADICGVGAP